MVGILARGALSAATSTGLDSYTSGATFDERLAASAKSAAWGAATSVGNAICDSVILQGSLTNRDPVLMG